jgi:hypothetical protein
MFVLRSKYQKLLDQNSDLIDDRDSLRTKLVQAQSDLADQTQDAQFAIDFARLRPFSIERNVSDGKPCTILGYFNKDGAVAEWYWFCSLKTHNQLVEEYNGYKAKKESN